MFVNFSFFFTVQVALQLQKPEKKKKARLLKYFSGLFLNKLNTKILFVMNCCIRLPDKLVKAFFVDFVYKTISSVIRNALN